MNKSKILSWVSKTSRDNSIEEKTHSSGFSYKTSKALIENITSKKGTVIVEHSPEDATQTDYVDKKGKKMILTSRQRRIVTAFATIIDSLLPDENVSRYISELTPDIIEDRESKNRPIKPQAVKTVIDIPSFSKIVYGKDRIGGKEVDYIRQDIVKLSEMRQQCVFKIDKKKTAVLSKPLIYLGSELTIYEEGKGNKKVAKWNAIEITFEDIFVYDIHNQFALAPKNLLQLWNETGVQTELFTTLLFLLLQVRFQFVSKARDEVKQTRKELREKNTPTDEIEKVLQKVKIRELTYKESIPSILERIDCRKYIYNSGKREGKLRPEKLRPDLTQAKDALLYVGIITDYYESNGGNGETICNFVINDNWLQEEADKLSNGNYTLEIPVSEDDENNEQ